MKDIIPITVIIIVVLGVVAMVVAGIVTDQSTLGPDPSNAPAIYGSDAKYTRFIDHEAGIVCWLVYDFYQDRGCVVNISVCKPISETLLMQR